MKDGDGDDGEDAGEEGGEQMERILFLFFFPFCFFHKAREAAKSGLVLFHEAMEQFAAYEDLKEQFQRFERAAAKGHEESIWIGSVVKDCLLYTSPSPRDRQKSRMPSSA